MKDIADEGGEVALC